MDVAYAKKLDMAIKLLASSKKEDDNFYAMVAPFLVNESNPLHAVNGVFNGIFVKGNVIGDIMFYGSGAGKLPTASAVVSDVVDCVKHINTNISIIWSSKKLPLTNIDEAVFRYFVRIEGRKANRLKDVTDAFGSIEEVVELEGAPDEFGVITDLTSEKNFKERAKKLDGIISRIRIK